MWLTTFHAMVEYWEAKLVHFVTRLYRGDLVRGEVSVRMREFRGGDRMRLVIVT